MHFRIRSEGKETLTLASMQKEAAECGVGKGVHAESSLQSVSLAEGNVELCSRQKSLHTWETAS